MASINSSTFSTTKPYFTDDITNKIHNYLFYSNYATNDTIYNADIYIVNLFVLTKIAKLLQFSIDKKKSKTHNKQTGLSGSIRSLRKNISKTFKFSSNSSNTKKQNNKVAKNKLIDGNLTRLLNFIIDKLQSNQQIEGYNEIADGYAKLLAGFLKNPILFNQELFGNKKFELVFNPEDIDNDKELNLSKIIDLKTSQKTDFNISDDFQEIKDIDIDLQLRKQLELNTQTRKSGNSVKSSNSGKLSPSMSRKLKEHEKANSAGIESREKIEKTLAAAEAAKKQKEQKEQINRKTNAELVRRLAALKQ